MKPLVMEFTVFEDPDQTGVDPGCVRWIAKSLGDFDFFGEGLSKEGAIENLRLAVQSEYVFAERDGRRFNLF